MSRTAFLFPGQGSQAVGMGKSLAENFAPARAVFDEVDAALGQKLSTLMFEGPEDQLTLTANAQPALMAVSLAVIRTLEAEKGLDLGKAADFVAGHSLGEYSALTAAGSLTISETAKLLRIRGDAMQAAVPVGRGAMCALIGAEWELAAEIAREAAQNEVCDVANDNGGGQVVLSGHKGAIDRAIEIAKAKGVKRALPLPVSAPFHSSLMQPAAEAMQTALATATILAPKVPVVANVLAAPVTDPEAIRRHLVEQVTGSVRWRESMLWLGANGVTRFVECGSGKVLAGIVKRVVAGSEAVSLGTADDISAYSA
ncbi:MAG: ACP S-malonyltransferase [Methylobacterium sp.]|nr:ACP S-malonyltransferase [Methylobacterium sp.]MCA3656038.1 ACP S-malonyltransferase [Methylobacterium sp.]MCA3658602.1 ACP S-malonyltransferase [Methylobacterium sp.]MCA3660785.1 ACP S-malonyltransferase [Methylobacterium sp.]MCA3663373.1 ACP S-malonyltransferase [Methylobacterium sp.]